MFRVICIKVRSPSYKQKKSRRVERSFSFVRRPAISWDKAIPGKVERTVHPHLSSCVRPLNPPDLDRSRPVTADNSTPEWRINTD